MSPILSSATFKAYVDSLLKEWAVPSISVSLVTRGPNGTAEAEAHFGTSVNGDKATNKSLFNIGSIAKSLTAFAIAILIDQGKLQWNSKIKDILPDFKVHDEQVTEEATVLDLLCHRTGVTKWQPFAATYLPQQTQIDNMRGLAYSTQAGEFRNSLIYNNSLYGALAEVIARLSGQSFPAFMQQNIFDVVGLKTATYNPDPEDVVPPSVTVEGGQQAIGLFSREYKDPTSSACHAAGCLFLSISDATTWSYYLVGLTSPTSQPRSKPLVSPLQLGVLMSPHNKQHIFFCFPPKADALKDIDYTASGYCCALNKYKYQDHLVYEHTGNMPGYAAQIVLAPEDGLGLFVFCPCPWTGNGVASIVALKVLEMVWKLEDVNWNERFKNDRLGLIKPFMPAIESDWVEKRSLDDFLQYCGSFEGGEGNAAVIFRQGDSDIPSPAKDIMARAKESELVHPWQKGFEPKLFLCHASAPQIEICCHYIALIPLGSDVFAVQARYLTTANGRSLDMQNRAIGPGVNGKLVYEREGGKVIGLKYTPDLVDVPVSMRKC